MKNLKAIHEIVRGSKVREVIKPKEVFEASEADAKFLVTAGAAVETNEAITVKQSAPAASEVSKVGHGGQVQDVQLGDKAPAGTETSEKALADMTVEELREYADLHGIEVKAGLKKAEVLAAIEAAEEDII